MCPFAVMANLPSHLQEYTEWQGDQLRGVSFKNLLSSRLLSKNLKINIYRTIVLPVVLYGCKTWSLTLLEERKLRGV